jgi:hypothetical protein
MMAIRKGVNFTPAKNNGIVGVQSAISINQMAKRWLISEARWIGIACRVRLSGCDREMFLILVALLVTGENSLKESDNRTQVLSAPRGDFSETSTEFNV